MCFPVWLRSYCDKHLSSTNGQNIKDHGHFDAIISLVSLSVNAHENVLAFLEKQLITYIIKIMNYSESIHKRYIPILDMIASLSNQSQEAADLFMKDLPSQKKEAPERHQAEDKNQQIFTILIKRIQDSLRTLNSSSSSKDTDAFMSPKKLLKMKTLAAEITTLGGLLNSKYRDKILKIKAKKEAWTDKKEEEIKKIIEKEKETDVVLNIISQMRNQKTDPIVLTAVCKFAKDVLECKEVLKSKETFQPYYDMMSEMRYIIPFLGKELYFPLVKSTRRYHMTRNKRQNDGLDDELKQLENGANQQAYKEAVLKSLSAQEDPYISELFVSIINLMHFICKCAISNNENELFEQFAEALDEAGREDVLFNCLAMSDDNVRLAVVKCLFVVPLDQFDETEIESIVKTISECTNISAGETELVLSTIYWICCKLVDVEEQHKESSKIFQSKFGQ